MAIRFEDKPAVARTAAPKPARSAPPAEGHPPAGEPSPPAARPLAKPAPKRKGR